MAEDSPTGVGNLKYNRLPLAVGRYRTGMPGLRSSVLLAAFEPPASFCPYARSRMARSSEECEAGRSIVTRGVWHVPENRQSNPYSYVLSCSALLRVLCARAGSGQL